MMFCFYIWNNVAIDFRIFAGGIAAGAGTMFFLLFNGLHIGAAAGYVNVACDPESFWSFVAGHSSFELLGMVVAGVAAGVSLPTVLRMMLHVGVEAVVGLVPVLGAVFDMAYKANNRNVSLLQRHELDPVGTAAESGPIYQLYIP